MGVWQAREADPVVGIRTWGGGIEGGQDRANAGKVVHYRVDVGPADGAEFHIDNDLSVSRSWVA